jgi:ATP-dependent Clp protease ATP-binding subunit ClpC
MTSNLGAQYTKSYNLGFSYEKGCNETSAKDRVFKALKEAFKPELLDRIDEAIYFSPLSEDSIKKICAIQLEDLKKDAKESGFDLEFAEGTLDVICKSDNRDIGGARHLRRRITKLIRQPLAQMIISGSVKKNSLIVINPSENQQDLLMSIK